MNDKATSVLEQYDMTINRTFKGRGTIICDTEKGMRVLKEYKGRTEKLELLLQLQSRLGDNLRTDTLIRNKEGGLYVRDIDNSIYILEEQVEGKECSYKRYCEGMQCNGKASSEIYASSIPCGGAGRSRAV